METGEVQQQERPRRRKVEDILVAQNKAAARDILEGAYSKGDLSVLDRIVADDVSLYDVTGSTMGLDAYREHLQAYRRAFPDIRLDVQNLVGEADFVVAFWLGRGTHAGEFMGLAPTGALAVDVSGVSAFRFEDGKLREERTRWDVDSWIRQTQAPYPFVSDQRFIEEATREVSDLLATFEDAFNRQDAKAAAECFTEDGTAIGPLGKLAIGRREIESLIRDDLETFLKGGTRTFSLTRLRLLSSGLAFADVDLTAFGLVPSNGSGTTLTLHVVGDLRRVGSRWLWSDARPHTYLRR